MVIKETVLDELLEETNTPEDLLGQDGLLKQLTKRLVERMLEGEMTTHLGYEKYSPKGRKSGNSRNGHTSKKLHSDHGTLELAVPRDREGSFEPLIVPKRTTRIAGFDDKVISLYGRGLSDRDIEAHLQDLYGVALSPSLISNITEQVMEEAKAWQNRPLEAIYPIVYMDALRVKIRQDGHIQNKAVHLVLGVNLQGQKEILGVWFAENEGAKFWLKVLTDLQNRGVEDILIACVDGLKGFPEAIGEVYPHAQVQLCMVHMVRNSLKYVASKDYKEVCADLKLIYKAATLEGAEAQLTAFSDKWDDVYPSISQIWLRNWENVIPLFQYPEEIRKVIYTTNAIESVNRSLRKVIKTRGSFPSDDSALKLIYLALQNISKKWTMPIQNWARALNRFVIMFEERMLPYL